MKRVLAISINLLLCMVFVFFLNGQREIGHPPFMSPHFSPIVISQGKVYVASPVVAGQNLIFVSEEGLLSVVRAGKEFKLLGQLNVEENIRVTPAVGIENLYLRGDSHLWAFGK